MGDSPQDLLDIYWLARQIAWRYKLDAYDDEVLATIQKTVTKARREILGRFEAQLLRTDWTATRAEEVLYALDDLTAGLRQSMADQLGDAAGFAGQYSLAEHSSILSVGGAALAVSSVEVSADQLRQMFVDTPLGGKTLAGWVDSAFDATVRAGIREELNAGVLQGEGYPKLVKRLTQGFEALSREQAVTLTRTYVQSANVAAAEAVYKRNADVVSRVKWRSVLEPGYKKTGRGTCLRCASLDSKEWALNDESRPDCPLHPRCLTGETPVFAPDKIAAFVAPYSGPVFEVGLSNGARFTVTPDHLFLTRNGFTPAKLLREGTNVFHDPRAKVVVSSYPNDDRNPSAIKDVVEAMAKAPGMMTKRVPISPEYLHGDGRFVQGYIDVVAPDSLLRGDIESFLAEHGGKFDLMRPNVVKETLTPEGLSMEPLLWLRLATECGMSGESVSEVFLRRAGEHHQSVRDSEISRVNTGLIEPSPDYVARHLVSGGQGVFRFPGDIGGGDIFNGEGNARHPLGFSVDRLDTVSLESVSHCGDVNAELLRELSRGFPGQISFADVLFCRETYFSGHVYDLQTFSSLYYVGGAVSSNCRCILVPVTISWRDLGIDIDELEDAARPYTIRPDKNIGAGGRREILEYGQHKGDYGSWFEKQDEAFKLNVVGPGRLALLQEGKVKFEDFVDGAGNLRTLEELQNAR